MVLSFAAVDIVLRRLFTTLLFYFQCFGLHYIALLFAWNCCCPHEHFCSSRLFFHFDYFCFLVNLHRSDQSNPRGNVTNCSFRFIHSISVMFFFFQEAWPFVSILSDVAAKVSFGSSCGYPWNGFTESADQTSFHSLSWGCTSHLQWDLFSGCILLSFGLLSKTPQPADEKQSNVAPQRSI